MTPYKMLKLLTENLTWTGMGRLCGRSSHTSCSLKGPAGGSLVTTELHGSNHSSPLNFLFPFVQKGAVSCCGVCACSSPWLHVLDCNSFFFPNKSFLVTKCQVKFYLQLTKTRSRQTVLNSIVRFSWTYYPTQSTV